MIKSIVDLNIGDEIYYEYSYKRVLNIFPLPTGDIELVLVGSNKLQWWITFLPWTEFKVK